jgi:hypothetical protein
MIIFRGPGAGKGRALEGASVYVQRIVCINPFVKKRDRVIDLLFRKPH